MSALSDRFRVALGSVLDRCAPGRVHVAAFTDGLSMGLTAPALSDRPAAQRPWHARYWLGTMRDHGAGYETAERFRSTR